MGKGSYTTTFPGNSDHSRDVQQLIITQLARRDAYNLFNGSKRPTLPLQVYLEGSEYAGGGA